MRSIVGWTGGLAIFWAGLALAGGSPDQKLMALRDALVRDDVPGLVRLAVAAPEIDKARAEIVRGQREEISADSLEWRRKDFDGSFGALLPAGAAEALLERVRPRLGEARAMFMLGSGAFFFEAAQQIRDDQSLESAERTQLLALLQAAQLYLARVDVFDEHRMHKAISELSRAARATALQSYDQFRLLDFDTLLGRFGGFLPAGKRAFAAYDLDVNAILRSARFRTAAQDLDQATVSVQLTLLDVPVEFPMELHAWQGDWYLVTPEPEPVPMPNPEAEPFATVEALMTEPAAAAEAAQP